MVYLVDALVEPAASVFRVGNRSNMDRRGGRIGNRFSLIPT